MADHPDIHVLNWSYSADSLRPVEAGWFSYHSISLFRRGFAHYKAKQISNALVPGSIVLGLAGSEYTCNLEFESTYDSTVFEYSEAALEELASVDGGLAANLPFKPTVLPAASELIACHQLALMALNHGCGEIWLEELAYDFASRVFRTLARTVKNRGSGALAIERRTDRERIHAAVRFMEANLGEEIRLGNIANAAGLSAYHFLRLFTKVTGLTPHQYLIYLRISEAVKLLAQTSLSIAMIAEHVGFNDLATFSYAFSRKVHQAPSAVRAVSQRLNESTTGWLPVQILVTG